MADSTFVGGSKLAKLKVLIPTQVCKFIAVAARDCEQYGDLVHIVGAQLMDPLMGLARG